MSKPTVFLVAALMSGLTSSAISQAIPDLGRISGVVIDSVSGEPVAGAVVRLERRAGPSGLASARTDISGTYEIFDVPIGTYSVVCDRFGYSPRRLRVDVRSSFVTQVDCLLPSRRTVVTKASSGAAFTITDTASGKTATVDVSSGITFMSDPAGRDTLARVRVRGLGAVSVFQSSDPLYVIDGVVIGKADSVSKSFKGQSAAQWIFGSPILDPSDIESIEVLKGAEASALYGRAATNGAVVLKTRSHEVWPQWYARLDLQKDITGVRNAPQLRSLADTAEETPQAWIEKTVFYATRRNAAPGSALATYYGEQDDTLKYGVATVTMPTYYHPGREDTRGICKYLPGPLHCSKEPSKTVMLTALNGFAADTWLSALSQSVDVGDTSKSVLIYVHGYNNSFSDAVTRAAQIAYSVGFEGTVATYDWSSRNSVPKYIVDQERAERSVPDFEKFIRRIADSTHARHLAVVAHSMGTRLVSYALRDLYVQRPDLRFGPVIFAASDVDSAIFVDQLAKFVAEKGAPVTLYASSRDRVLRLSASEFIHEGRRVGSGPPSIVLYPGIDYIDASPIDTDLLGHGYFVDNKELVDDIFLLMRHSFGASQRNLLPMRIGTRLYYRLK
jgi:TonB-dependent SusC/RagA subfamily outer membrane receptor